MKHSFSTVTKLLRLVCFCNSRHCNALSAFSDVQGNSYDYDNEDRNSSTAEHTTQLLGWQVREPLTNAHQV